MLTTRIYILTKILLISLSRNSNFENADMKNTSLVTFLLIGFLFVASVVKGELISA